MTPFIKKKEIKNDWYLINAENAVVGRLAAYISKVLRGKNKPTYNKHIDNGDFVIVTNINKMKFTGKKLTLYSFRHSYAIRRITMLNGNVFDVMKEMGHTNTQTTMEYLRFPLQRRLDDFPSLKDYIESRQNMILFSF